MTRALSIAAELVRGVVDNLKKVAAGKPDQIAAVRDAEVGILDMSTHSTHASMEMARRYSRKTPKQLQHAASKRLAGRKKT